MSAAAQIKKMPVAKSKSLKPLSKMASDSLVCTLSGRRLDVSKATASAKLLKKTKIFFNSCTDLWSLFIFFVQNFYLCFSQKQKHSQKNWAHFSSPLLLSMGPCSVAGKIIFWLVKCSRWYLNTNRTQPGALIALSAHHMHPDTAGEPRQSRASAPSWRLIGSHKSKAHLIFHH